MPDDVSFASTEFYQVTPGRQVTLEVTTWARRSESRPNAARKVDHLRG
jgi:hypothetical protein